MGPNLASVLTQRLGYAVSANEPFFANAGSVCTSTTQCVFPNGFVPQTSLDPAAAGMLQYIPNAVQDGYFTGSNNQQETDDRGGTRIDYDSKFGLLSFYYFIGDTSNNKAYGANNIPGFPSADVTHGKQFNLGSTTSFGSTAVNEFRFNFTRFVADSNQPEAGVGPGTLSKLGFVVNEPGGITPALRPTKACPTSASTTLILAPLQLCISGIRAVHRFLITSLWCAAGTLLSSARKRL